MTEAKVVSLDGRAVDPGEPDPEVIAALRRWLADAERGEFVAIGLCATTANGKAEWERAGEEPRGLAHAISMLQFEHAHACWSTSSTAPVKPEEPAT